MGKQLSGARSSMVVLIIDLGSVAPALAARINGKVTYVGTQAEYNTAAGGYQAVFRMRISESTCEADKAPKDRWVLVRSGRMDGIYAHNAANFENAYSTVMTSMLTGKVIEIDGVPNCTATAVQTLDLPHAGIGLFK